jgi:hypothetical protein
MSASLVRFDELPQILLKALPPESNVTGEPLRRASKVASKVDFANSNSPRLDWR